MNYKTKATRKSAATKTTATKKNTKKATTKYDKTYIITDDHDDINFQPLRDILEKKYNLSPIDENKPLLELGSPSFVYFKDTLQDLVLKRQLKKLYNINALIFNMLDKRECIANKYNLYYNMLKLNPKMARLNMANSFRMSPKTTYTSPGVYIAKPVEILHGKYIQCGGRDIIIYNTKNGLQKAKQLLKKYKTVLVSEYITNPMLFKGFKFHFRIYFIAAIVNNKFQMHYLDLAPVYTAKKPYSESNYDDTEIHDTHLKSTPADYFFFKNRKYASPANGGFVNVITPANTNASPTPDIDKIWQQIDTILANVATIYKKEATLFSNTANGFYIFSGDFMITRDNIVKLLEINDMTGIDFRSGDNKLAFDRHLFQLLDKHILAPVFKSI